MSTGSLKIYFAVKFYNFKEFFLALKYYKNFCFCLVDFSLFLVYFFFNPYNISKRFLIKNKSSNIHAYGETPLTTLDLIVKNCGINANDRCIELGSGRGRTAFWLSHFIKCDLKAIERIAFFSNVAKALSKIFRIKNTIFMKEDMFRSSFDSATVIYLYGTMLEDDQILCLIEKFKKIKGLKIITISYPLKDYDSSFTTIKSFDVSFPWGTTTCYLNKQN